MADFYQIPDENFKLECPLCGGRSWKLSSLERAPRVCLCDCKGCHATVLWGSYDPTDVDDKVRVLDVIP